MFCQLVRIDKALLSKAKPSVLFDDHQNCYCQIYSAVGYLNSGDNDQGP